MSVVLGEYGYYALHTKPGSVPGGVLALWLRSLAWVAVAAMAVVIVAGALSPGPIGGDPLPGTPQNPPAAEAAISTVDERGSSNYSYTSAWPARANIQELHR